MATFNGRKKAKDNWNLGLTERNHFASSSHWVYHWTYHIFNRVMFVTANTPSLITIYEKQLQKQDTIKPPWKGSRNEFFKKLKTPQLKGKLGVLVYVEFLKRSGCIVEEVSDEGDVLYRTPDGLWQKDEVKTAAAAFTWRKKDQKYSKQHWFNQVRPNQKSWNNIVLIAVDPDKYQIYKMSRQDYFTNKNMGLAGIAPGHTGTNDLDKVVLVDNSSKNCYNDWTLIHEGV